VTFSSSFSTLQDFPAKKLLLISGREKQTTKPEKSINNMNDSSITNNSNKIQFNFDAIEETIREGISQINNNNPSNNDQSSQASSPAFTMSQEARELSSEYILMFVTEAINRSIKEAKTKKALSDHRSLMRPSTALNNDNMRALPSIYDFMDDDGDENHGSEQPQLQQTPARRTTTTSVITPSLNESTFVSDRLKVSHEHLESIAAQLFFDFK